MILLLKHNIIMSKLYNLIDTNLLFSSLRKKFIKYKMFNEMLFREGMNVYKL